MINRKFLNFKTYNAFLEKLNSNEIPQDSIVFIQDKLCIWAHGKEYQCSGPSTSTAADGTLTFNDFKGNTVFTITQRDGILKLTDSEGNSISATYILKADYNVAIGNINRDIEDLKNADK
jgi:outer membrane protein assembly factor BamB